MGVSSKLRNKDGSIWGVMDMHKMGAGNVSHDLCAGQHLNTLLSSTSWMASGAKPRLGRHYGKKAVLAVEKGDFAAMLDFFDLDARSGGDIHLYL